MYESNHLISQLHASSQGQEDRVFAQIPTRAPVTFGGLFAGAERYAAALVALGLQPGDRVAVQVEKTIEAIQLYLGTVMAGGVFLPLNTAYTTAELGYFIGDASPRVVVCDPARQEAISSIAAAATVMTLDAKGRGSLSDAAARHNTFTPVARRRDDLAAILYTSGTTGRSKGAMLSHENLASNSRMLRDYWQFTRDDVLIHALPIFHTHGLFVATNVALFAGAQVVFLTGFDKDKILEAMPQATALMGVPTFYTRLLQDERLTRERAANMRLFISGSAPLLVDTHEQWEARTGHRILERYGMTETGMNTSNPLDGERIAGTVGFPLPGTEVRIMDESGQPCATNGVGSLQVKGANVFQGYWRMPEKTAEEFTDDGFFITGDLGTINDKDYVSIVGRSKDLIISGGYNIYPKEIELVLNEVPGVLESAVFAFVHPDFGEGVAAAIVKDGSAEVTEEQITAVSREHLAGFKVPRRVLFLDELPRNTMGKVQKNLLRDQYGQKEL